MPSLCANVEPLAHSSPDDANTSSSRTLSRLAHEVDASMGGEVESRLSENFSLLHADASSVITAAHSSSSPFLHMTSHAPPALATSAAADSQSPLNRQLAHHNHPVQTNLPAVCCKQQQQRRHRCCCSSSASSGSSSCASSNHQQGPYLLVVNDPQVLASLLRNEPLPSTVLQSANRNRHRGRDSSLPSTFYSRLSSAKG